MSSDLLSLHLNSAKEPTQKISVLKKLSKTKTSYMGTNLYHFINLYYKNIHFFLYL